MNKERMEKKYRKWFKDAPREGGNLDPDLIEEKLDEIADEYGFETIIKDELLIIYANEEGELAFAWHLDHGRSWGEDETGFDQTVELEDLWNQELISEKAYRVVLSETAEMDEVPEKLREAVEKYFEDPQSISVKEYQNIYHNLYAKDPEKLKRIGKKYLQKAKLSMYFNNIGFKMPRNTELSEENFGEYIGESIETLKGINIFQWWPVVEDGIVTNFISAYGDLYLPEEHDVKNIKILEDIAVVKQK